MSQSGMPAGDLHEETQGRYYHENFEFHIDVRKQLVHVKFSERVTSEEIASYAKVLGSHPHFRPAFAEIVDLREAAELNLQANDFLRLADEVDPFSKDAKRAFVVRTSVQNHAARMHKILRSLKNTAIFNSIDAAEHWIRSS